MERLVTKELLDWYSTNDERILLLRGGYSIGKTWVIRSFCREYDEHYIHISMSDVDELIDRIHISSKATFLVIDDISDEEMLARACRIVLKLRSDEALPDYRVILVSTMVRLSAGVLDIVDMDYVRLVMMHPMNFHEFARAVKDKREWDGVTRLDDMDMFKMYLVAGGMPECVSLLLQDGDMTSVRRKQREIVSSICSKLAGKHRKVYTKELELLEAISIQNMDKGAGFSLRQVRRNARAREYGAALCRLEQCGLVHRISRYGVTDEGRNVSSSRIRDYKLYVTDVGLAGAIALIDEKLILEDDKLMTEGNGLLYITCVLQECIAADIDSQWELCYWHKQRAKAKLPLICRRKRDGHLVLINANIFKRRSVAKSIYSFLKEHSDAKVVDLSAEDVTCGIPWHNIL